MPNFAALAAAQAAAAPRNYNNATVSELLEVARTTDELRAARDRLAADLDAARAARDQLRVERDAAVAKRDQMRAKRNELQAERDSLLQDRAELCSEVADYRNKYQATRSQMEEMRTATTRAAAALTGQDK